MTDPIALLHRRLDQAEVYIEALREHAPDQLRADTRTWLRGRQKFNNDVTDAQMGSPR